jgi:hypothetical protein
VTPHIHGSFHVPKHVPPAAAAGPPEVEREVERTPKRKRAPVTTFRTVDSGVKPKKALGPEVEREVELVRHLVDPEPHEGGSATATPDDEASNGDEAAAESKPVPAWRRTAMAELTALAADSDDLTPRRRR